MEKIFGRELQNGRDGDEKFPSSVSAMRRSEDQKTLLAEDSETSRIVVYVRKKSCCWGLYVEFDGENAQSVRGTSSRAPRTRPRTPQETPQETLKKTFSWGNISKKEHDLLYFLRFQPITIVRAVRVVLVLFESREFGREGSRS